MWLQVPSIDLRTTLSSAGRGNIVLTSLDLAALSAPLMIQFRTSLAILVFITRVFRSLFASVLNMAPTTFLGLFSVTVPLPLTKGKWLIPILRFVLPVCVLASLMSVIRGR